MRCCHTVRTAVTVLISEPDRLITGTELTCSHDSVTRLLMWDLLLLDLLLGLLLLDVLLYLLLLYLLLYLLGLK